MKKLLGWTFGIIFVIGMIGSCTEEEVVKEEPKKEPKQEEVKKEEKEEKEKAAAEQEAKEKKEAEEAKKAEEASKVESQYLGDMQEGLQVVSTAMGKISENSFALGENPTLMYDEDWLMNMALALNQLDLGISEIKAIKEPNDSVLKESHALVLKAMDTYQFAVDNLPNAIDNMDVELLQKCSEQIKTGNDYLNQANELIDTKVTMKEGDQWI